MADAKWYIINAYSNFEKKVAAHIREQSVSNELDHLIEQLEVPTEEVVEVVRGKKRTTERRYFPGYVLMRATLTDEIYHLVKNTPKVSGFLGAESGKKPLPVPDREVNRILGEAEEAADRPRPTINFEVGEKVRVNDGAFQGFEGDVMSVDEPAARLTVTVSIFGRETPVDLEYGQVDKLD